MSVAMPTRRRRWPRLLAWSVCILAFVSVLAFFLGQAALSPQGHWLSTFLAFIATQRAAFAIVRLCLAAALYLSWPALMRRRAASLGWSEAGIRHQTVFGQRFILIVGAFDALVINFPLWLSLVRG